MMAPDLTSAEAQSNDALTASANRLSSARCVILPLGSVEFHGAHAPLGVDTTVAKGLAQRLAERMDAVALPAIPFAYASTLTSGHPGTLSIAADVYLAYLTEVLRALSKTGVTRVLALNAHSENQFALRLAAEQVASEQSIAGQPPFSALLVNWWQWVEPGDAPEFSDAAGHGHGGPLEVSVAAAFNPRGITEATTSRLATPSADIAYEAPYWRGKAQVVGAGQAPQGFAGYHNRPSEISAAVGARVVEALLPRLATLADDWLARAGSSSPSSAVVGIKT